jgi:hypothetical protein
VTNHKLDTDSAVFFYEQEFYALSNFSSFRLMWSGIDFDTVEHAYHWSKFTQTVDPLIGAGIRSMIRSARSAHEAYKLAQECKEYVRPDWLAVRNDEMRYLLAAKLRQHHYVWQKLLQTGDRLLVEDSWRDSYWGIGPDGDGENNLGKIWMGIRTRLREEIARDDS